MKHLFATAVLASALILAGCTTSPTASDTEPTESQEAEAQVSASEITTLEDGLTWAAGLSATTPNLSKEISTGVQTLGDLVADADFPAMTNNAIGQALISINADVLGDPDNAADYIPDVAAAAALIKLALDAQ